MRAKRSNLFHLYNGFSLLEVIIALGIALLMLSALLSLEIKTSSLAARFSTGLETLPLAIERIEDLTSQDFSGVSHEYRGEYEIRTTAKEIVSGIPLTRIQVEVLFNDKVFSELSLYKFKIHP